MRDFKSAQELIVKAILREGIMVTLRPANQSYCPAIEVKFYKDGEYVTRCIELEDMGYGDAEEAALYTLQHALFDLLEYPYKQIKVGGNEDEG